MSGIKTYVQTDMRVAPTQDNHLVRMRDMMEYVSALTTETVRCVLTEPLVGTYDSASLTLEDSITESDGVTLVVGNRVLVAGQLDKTQNGIYMVESIDNTYALIRANDFNNATNIRNGLIVPVSEGDTYGMTRWRTVLGAIPFVLDATIIEFQREIVDLARVVEFTYDIIGDDTETTYDITHGLSTVNVTHELVDGEGSTVVGELRRMNSNVVRVLFGVPLGIDNDLTLILRAEINPV